MHFLRLRCAAVAAPILSCVASLPAFAQGELGDVPQSIDFYDTWQPVPTNCTYDNAFRAEWELFLRHVVDGGPFQWNLLEGAKGVQLAELGAQSWRERRFVDVPALVS